MLTILQGDALAMLRTLPDSSVQTCVTSPPYWQLRDYEVEGQIGMEPTPEEYVAALVEVFREVRRVLQDDGTLWLNLGDSYFAGGSTTKSANDAANYADREFTGSTLAGTHPGGSHRPIKPRKHPILKPKDLIGLPWRVALSLQSDGWWLRQDIIWHKPNPFPGPQRDRCTTAHEYLFLLSKSAKYLHNPEAFQEPAITGGTRTRRSVWTVPVAANKRDHSATFPPDLIRPCILATSTVGGTVLDPFAGTGTTAEVALQESRSTIAIDLDPKYKEMIEERARPFLQPRLF